MIIVIMKLWLCDISVVTASRYEPRVGQSRV